MEGAQMEPLRAIALGWGVQSFGLCALSAEGKLPPVDFAVFADTTYEASATYRYMEKYTPWLKERGIDVRTVVDDSVTASTKDVDEWGAVFIPAFTKHRDTHEPAGLLRRQCTGTWKIDPIRRLMQKERARGQKCEMWLGITLDEVSRVKPSNVQYVTNIFPYIDTLGWSRGDVVNYLAKLGIEPPPKSACVFCPYRSESSMKKIQQDPDDWEMAVNMDEAIREKRRGFLSYVRRELVPLKDMDFDNGQMELFEEECEGYCGL